MISPTVCNIRAQIQAHQHSIHRMCVALAEAEAEAARLQKGIESYEQMVANLQAKLPVVATPGMLLTWCPDNRDSQTVVVTTREIGEAAFPELVSGADEINFVWYTGSDMRINGHASRFFKTLDGRPVVPYTEEA